ncbi:MAG: hypothetical protein HYU74_12680 [Dechloromonas sp.]|nr:hypothetical protein [Dechloromonas sp.]
MRPSLKIAGAEISIIAMLDFEQSLEPIGGSSTRRMGGGAPFTMTHWGKHRIQLSASGWIPAPLNSIATGVPFELELPWPEAFAVGEALPAGWTSRAAPWDEKTVTDQAGNSIRLVWPKMTVISTGPAKRHGNTKNPSWELTCETV